MRLYGHSKAGELPRSKGAGAVGCFHRQGRSSQLEREFRRVELASVVPRVEGSGTLCVRQSFFQVPELSQQWGSFAQDDIVIWRELHGVSYFLERSYLSSAPGQKLSLQEK
jgi:hypothetical protein